MNIFIFSGTTEGRELSLRLQKMGHQVTVSVATGYGKAAQGPGPVRILEGRMQEDEMERALSGFDLCIDATHPYAEAAGRNIRKAAGAAGVPYLRLQREESPIPENAVTVRNAKEAADYLSGREGRILLTTGSKELSAFAEIARERLIVRILPSLQSLEEALTADIPLANIIAMEGPFSEAFNELLIREKKISFLVTKDGGRPGGFPEKAEACRACGTTMVLIRRPEGREGDSMETILQKIEEGSV